MPDSSAINSPQGFLFSTAEAAIKKAGRKDMAVIYSEKECVVSGMFTTNRIKAAPVKIDLKKIRSGKGQAIIVNSGNANACTGEQGLKDAVDMADFTASSLGLKSSRVYVCSTGVIGTPMPMERIISGIDKIAKNLGKSTIVDVAEAIMTTDSFPKISSRSIKIGSKTASITGICKGAGMICPNMATMLCFIFTDASIEKSALDMALRDAVEKSFNRITIDGDMSTNDTVLIMANGLAGNSIIGKQSSAFKKFSSAIAEITLELSRMIVMDGEGASKLIEVEVKNARSNKDAENAAFAIANSLLVKTAIYGNDANWGRIMAALGYSKIAIKEDKTDIVLNGLKIVSKGMGTGKDKEANERLKSKEINLLVDLKLGKSTARVLTCDLSEDYVRINAEYRT